MRTTGTPLRPRSAIHAFADRRAPLALPCALVALGWAVALAAALTHRAYLLEHHYWLARPEIPAWAPLAIFLTSWQVMLLAMMLPASLPTLAAVCDAEGGWRPAAAQLVFLLGYAVPWTAFGLAAYLGDAGLFALSALGLARDTHLGDRAGDAAGRRALSADPCQAACPADLWPVAIRKLADGWRAGRRHGVACIGAGWALMLIMFDFGMTNLTAMLALTAVMVAEQVTATA